MTKGEIFTLIKRRIQKNTHLDDRAKEIVFHIMLQVYKSIPDDEAQHSEGETTMNDTMNGTLNGTSRFSGGMETFNELFGGAFKDIK